MAKPDVDALLDSFHTHNGPRCKISSLTGPARAVFDRALERHDVSAPAVVRALASLGVQVDRFTVGRHRSGECATCRGK